MTTERPGYLAYLLRLWRVNDDGKPVWRASLENPHTGERHGFANLELLFAFLEEKTGELAQREEPAKDFNQPRAGLQRHPDNSQGTLSESGIGAGHSDQARHCLITSVAVPPKRPDTRMFVSRTTRGFIAPSLSPAQFRQQCPHR